MFAASYEQIDQTNTSQSRKRKRLTSSYSTDKGLPENYDYTDTGCDLAPSCLECPLALCKYDDPNWGRRNRTAMRDQEIVRLRGQGLKVSQIAKIVKTSERTVYRVALREGIQLPGQLRGSADQTGVIPSARNGRLQCRSPIGISTGCQRPRLVEARDILGCCDAIFRVTTGRVKIETRRSEAAVDFVLPRDAGSV